MSGLLRIASVVPGIPVVSIACWYLITLLSPVETNARFVLALLIFFVWQAYILYTCAFILLHKFTRNFWIELFVCILAGGLSGMVCASLVAGVGGLIFGMMVGPGFGLLFGAVVGNWQRRKGDGAQ